jgi:hypothetical protein
MSKLRLAILRNEIEDEHLLWVKACQEYQHDIAWEVIDLTRSNWLEAITSGKFDGLLAIPSGLTTAFRTMYEERIRILTTVCHMKVCPSLEEISIFENKKYFSYWLAAHQIPHPRTWVFYYGAEALDFAREATYPIVGKTSIGASGRGVSMLNNQHDLIQYIKNVFSGKGNRPGAGPNWQKKGIMRRVFQKIMNPSALKTKLKIYRYQLTESQKNFVILQEFIPHDFEWRCVRIGDSFFAHKKLMKGQKASGSLLKEYGNPPLALLDFVRELTDKHRFYSQAVDLFETPGGQYLVNEMQCIFGQSDPYQMMVDNIPGRYCFSGGEWFFEAGDFNRHESFLLRLEYFLETLSNTSTDDGIHRFSLNTFS